MEGFKIEGKHATSEPPSDIFALTGTSGRDGGFKALLGLMADRSLKFYRSAEEGEHSGARGGWLRLSAEELADAGHQFTLDEERMNVHTASL